MIPVLYVDDEPALLDLTKMFLERMGNMSVDVADSAQKALAMMEARRYDVIVSDYQMPGMDGIALLREIRRKGNTIPFIIFTGRGREEVAAEADRGNVRLINDIPEKTEIFADPLIRRVWFNLVDNSLRHGGKVTAIRFSVEEKEDGLSIVCEDDGTGIPPGEKEKIFGRGYGKNTGMGLFLSREILAITGISISENGEPGKGARFEIRVPPGKFRKGSAGP